MSLSAERFWWECWLFLVAGLVFLAEGSLTGRDYYDSIVVKGV